MPDTKTGGNRWVPDIRPENIDTYTEQNGDQSAQYKIVDAHPIIGGILNKLAFFRTHAAAVWYNRLAGITVKQKLDELNRDSSYIDADSYDSVLSAVKALAPEKNIFSFHMVYPTDDAPDKESWDYAYMVIPLRRDAWMVLAFRTYSSFCFWIRCCVANKWTGDWERVTSESGSAGK